MSHEVETAILAETAGWWDLAKEHVFGRPMTWPEAYEAGGINWPVELIPIEFGEEETGRNLLVRGTDDKVLNCVTDGYSPLQNWELGGYVGAVCSESELEIESAMSLKGGKVVVVCARSPEELRIAGDLHIKYCTAANWHDGTRMAHIFFSNMRTECWNTLNFSMESARNVFKFKHTGNIEEKVEEAKRQLEVGLKYLDAQKKMGEELAIRRLSLKEFDNEFLPTIAPAPRKTRDRETLQKAQAKVIETRAGIKKVCMDTPDLQNHRLGNDLTGWGVLQGVVAFTDHYQTNFRSPDTKFEHAMLEQSEYTERAVAYLTA